MILVIDNYDSFTYNLVQYLMELNTTVVYRNDRVSIEKIRNLSPSHIVISPGPGIPEKAGISCEVVEKFSGKIPILGICLGHQCIGYVFGGKIIRARKLVHGKTSLIYHNGAGLLRGIESPFAATRYHSLVVSQDGLPEEISVIATTFDGEIMGIMHKEHPTFGLQFHPESILTIQGKQILRNFYEYSGKEEEAYVSAAS